MSRNGGFTLIEIMVSVMLLASVAAASLKLVITAHRTLAETGDRQNLLNEAEAIETGIFTGIIAGKGTSGDISWVSEIRKNEMFGEDFGKLRFGASADYSPGRFVIKWREITVTDSKKRMITLCSSVNNGESAEAGQLSSVQTEENAEKIK